MFLIFLKNLWRGNQLHNIDQGVRWLREEEKIFLLTFLALRGALDKPIKISLRDIARNLGLSPQSISRRLEVLEKEGLINRSISGRGQLITLSSSGIQKILSFYNTLSTVLKPVKDTILVLKGRVFTGLGEGAFYMSRPEYRKQFIRTLGYAPYPGTLNIRLESSSIKYRKVLERLEGIKINPFANRSRKYGGGKLFKVRINGEVEGALIIPERTHYGPDVIEVIAPINLREFLKLKDGDWVTVYVHL